MKLFKLKNIQFNRYMQTVRSYLSKTLAEYNITYNNSSIFGQLINVMEGVVQNIMLYIEDSLTEQNKFTAQRKKSVYGLAALSGYNASFGSASGVQLRMSFMPNNDGAISVIINNKEKLTCSQNGLPYCIMLSQDAIVMSLVDDPGVRYIYAVQGTFDNQVFVSSGGDYYTQNVRFSGNIDLRYLEVYINNIKWQNVASVYDMSPMGEQYTVRTSYNSGIDIIFGNGTYGKPLADGDTIKVVYLSHNGESGNMTVDNETYFTFDNPLHDVSGNTVDGNNIFSLTFAVPEPVISGSNSEDINQVRNMIGLNSRSLVLASPDNYRQYLSRFSFCGYNRTWTEKGSMVINSIIMKNYKLLMKEGKDYFNLSEKDMLLTDSQKQSIYTSIENDGSQMAGIIYNIFDPIICKYAMYIYIKMKSSKYDTEYVRNQIRNIVGEFFSDISSDIFIPKSDISNLIKNEIDSVDSVDIYILSEENETAIKTGQYSDTRFVFNRATGAYEKKTTNMYIYPGENPNIGLDQHGNIYLDNDTKFPVLMGGWTYKTSDDQLVQAEPLSIIFE